MRDRIAIIGAGGHARVVLDVLRRQPGMEAWGFVDDDDITHGRVIDGVPVLGPVQALQSQSTSFDAVVVAIGDNAARMRLAALLADWSIPISTLVHPSAIVGSAVEIGAGTVVMAGTIIQPGTTVGKNVIINTGASVDHDCVLGDGVHVGPGVRLAGSVYIGRATFLGIGSVVTPRVSIGDYCIVGAGSVVVRSLPHGVVAYGVPAKIRREATIHA